MERGRRKGRKGKSATQLNQHKAAHKHNGGVDRVSELPNDILISIIRRLTFREAMATSVLSSEWHYIHTHATHLHFPPCKPVWTNDIESEKRRFQKHIEIINRLMDSQQGGVKELKLQMPLRLAEGGSSSTSTSMKKWVEFALTKDDMESIYFRMPYDWKLGLSELVKTIGQPLLRCLKRLRLEGVGVNDHDLEALTTLARGIGV